MEKIRVKISWSGDNYCAEINYFGIIATTSKSLEKLFSEIRNAFRFHVNGCVKDGDEVSAEILSGNFEFQYTYEVSALLHKLDGIVSRAAIARITGINERQIGHYASGLHNPREEQRKKIIEGIHNLGQQLLSV